MDNTSPLPPDAPRSRRSRPQTNHDLDLTEEVRRLLALHRGQWKYYGLAEAADVSYSWLSKFVRGETNNPAYAKLKRLHAILAKWPAPPAPDDPPAAPPPLRLAATTSEAA